MRLYKANSLFPFSIAYRQMKSDILNQPLESVGQWQSQPTDIKTRELMGAVLEFMVPHSQDYLLGQVPANLPWAEDHFQERISGVPLNPPPSEAWWPFNQNGNAAHKNGTTFSHTYPERFWPKDAGRELQAEWTPDGPNVWDTGPNRGIRYPLGDLRDLIDLLRGTPGTRQAYLPVWFPEDTGAVHGERVPCSLGYHFLIRNGRLHCWYSMRSCDLLRHFPDDVYMAARLMQYVVAEVAPDRLQVGTLTMSMSSLHTFESDDPFLERELLKGGRR